MSSVNTGKAFEKDFADSARKITGAWVYRLRDGTASYDGQTSRFQTRNIADYIMYHQGTLYILELKSVKDGRLPFSDISYSNLCEMVDAAKTDGIQSLFVINYRQERKASPVTVVIPAEEIKIYMDIGERKSIPLAWALEHGTAIPQIRRRTRWSYDVRSILR